MTNTASPFTMVLESDSTDLHKGVAVDIASAISGAWAMANHFEDFVLVRDHRDDPTGIEIVRIGVEWLEQGLNSPAAERDYESELAGEEEPPSFRHTSCKLCSLDVEVDLTDLGMSTRDRGGSASCPDGKAHDPALDDADYEAHEWHTGVVAG